METQDQEKDDKELRAIKRCRRHNEETKVGKVEGEGKSNKLSTLGKEKQEAQKLQKKTQIPTNS